MIAGQPQDVRFERKAVLLRQFAPHADTWINVQTAAFSTAFPPRYVNNVYLDTPNLENYHRHLMGMRRRWKLRIRWYGDLLGKISNTCLEIKIRDGGVGHKLHWPTPEFDWHRQLPVDFVRRMADGADLPPFVRQMLLVSKPALINRYHRRYLASLADPGVRLTIDQQLCFYRVDRPVDTPMGRRRDDRTILEMKYRRDSAESAEQLLTGLPVRITQYSKYCSGIELLHQ